MKTIISVYILTIIYSVAVLILGCGEVKHNRSVIKVKSIFVNKNVLTRASVDCDKFETQFSDFMSENIVSRTKLLNEITNSLEEDLFKDKSKSIDVRAKVYLYFSDSTSGVICIDAFGGMILNDSLFSNNKRLYKNLVMLTNWDL